MGCVGGGDLYHRQHVRYRVHARSAVFGRHFDAHQAVLAEQADVVQRELAGTVVMLRTRGDLLLRDAPRHVLQHQLLFSKAEIHNTLPGT
ncbi:hypothetical protein G6F32_017356 [Rhizopus arrhizus]|nr:hypothetical protein G6F32_017356 [Rhizopus arrhizus]